MRQYIIVEGMQFAVSLCCCLQLWPATKNVFKSANEMPEKLFHVSKAVNFMYLSILFTFWLQKEHSGTCRN